MLIIWMFLGKVLFLHLNICNKVEMTKINYRIHTDTIKSNLIPAEVTKAQAVSEAQPDSYPADANSER